MKDLSVIETNKYNIKAELIKIFTKGYEQGITEDNINDDTFAEKVKEAYKDGYKKGLDDNAFSQDNCISLLQETGWMQEHDKQMYENGLDDAWEAVKRIENIPEYGGLTNQQIVEVFGQYWSSFELYHSFTVQEVIEKLKAWEDKQNEIKVGDEVISDAFDDKGIITHISPEGAVAIICNGSSMMKVGKMGLHKTGRHFDEIEAVLEKLRGEE